MIRPSDPPPASDTDIEEGEAETATAQPTTQSTPTTPRTTEAQIETTPQNTVTFANLMGSGIGIGMGLNGGSDHNSRSHLRNVLGRLGTGKLQGIQTGALMANSLPPGFVLIEGQVMDATYKENPIYMRPGNEAGWHFVVFQDPYYWRGSGHLILLKKVLGVNINVSPTDAQTLYEAYLLSLRMPIHASMDGMDSWTANKLQIRKGMFDLITARRMAYRETPNRFVPRMMGRNPLKNMARNKRYAKHKVENREEDCYMKRLNILVYVILVLVAAIGVPHAEAGLKRKIHGKKRLIHGGGGHGHRRAHGHHGRGHGHYG
ncbi:hypothetical protein Ocin01_16209 [Orchesella cincta]|uniref:Uncharacterized protein n=1 Tax=Orchesella cincta TaxID=48709 RepID=A0A1D2MBX6_ORCCI|nr:hypothetical protein Ocin01_16209 [Orchesella cincta]